MDALGGPEADVDVGSWQAVWGQPRRKKVNNVAGVGNVGARSGGGGIAKSGLVMDEGSRRSGASPRRSPGDELTRESDLES